MAVSWWLIISLDLFFKQEGGGKRDKATVDGEKKGEGADKEAEIDGQEGDKDMCSENDGSDVNL